MPTTAVLQIYLTLAFSLSFSSRLAITAFDVEPSL